MASSSIDELYLYQVPAAVMYSFYHVMDSLDDTDWKKFASMIIPDQTALRLLEQQGLRKSRTEEVMWHWLNRNARLRDLLSILRKLDLLRALHVLDCWRLEHEMNLAAARSIQPVKEPSPPTRTWPCPEQSDSQKRKSPSADTAPPPGNPLPLPGPPPSNLVCSSICPSKASSSDRSSSTNSNTHSSIQESSDDRRLVRPSNHLLWNFQEVMEGTRNFSKSFLIGEGGFGCVYKAVIRNTVYAVKRLKQDSELEWSTVKKSFLTEIEKLTCLRHPNIIDLAGYCMQGDEYCLIYLYLPNGSLEDRLHHQGSPTLTWKQRLGIVQGAACGIQFLHTCKPSIIHGDIKSSNILLDQALVAKLGDFGLARFSRYTCDAGKSRTLARTSTVRGTLAYLPDEYVKLGKLTFELDTYSFGVKDIVKEEESDPEAEISSLQGATGAKSAEYKLSRAASRICHHHLDFRLERCPAGVAQELCLLACRCLGRQKKRPSMVEVFGDVTRLQSLLHSLDPGYPGDGQRSVLSEQLDSFPPVLDLLSSLQASVLTPQENTDKFTPCGISASSGSLRLCGPCALQCEDKLVNFCSISSSGSRTFQRTPNLPEESDESLPESSLAAALPGLPCGPHPRQQGAHSPHHGPALQCRSTVLAASDVGSSAGAGSSLQGGSSLASGPSQAISMPHHQIIVNPAKQRFVEQLALYDQGKINSLELLYSGTSPEYNSEGRGYPEESDDFPS
ncbi:hypothetical protein GDO81_003786 [Engystomops pustulosus]|uniref:Interleukin-1 receptor-associated kinase 1 n=1 Tax=Engystomops pustulosus TaxID=76066 RepID=A0AAV7A3Q8_ENGPU|nr:hypothetical protein GDO81_003786 [Engystomops pustulosus]